MINIKNKLLSNSFLAAATICTLLSLPLDANAREQVHIVGSSTVFPFISAVAETFGNDEDDFKTPIVESTGTGGGFKLFCSGIGANTPDIANASRPIKKGEIELCKKNNVKDITEVKLGFDGIVLANEKSQPRMNITIKQLFSALAKELPDESGKMAANPYNKWSDIDKSLPDTEIAVYGPPPTSGTRDAFVEIVMEKGCEYFKEFKELNQDKDKYKAACHSLRTDGKFIDAGENDNLIVQKLKGNKTSFGIFGYGFLEENAASVQGSLINDIAPEFENIADGSYPVARSLFVYIKNAHIGKIKGLGEFAKTLVDENTLSEDGYLVEKGLIPVQDKELQKNQEMVAELFYK